MRDYQTKSNKGGLPDSINAERFGAGEFNSLADENKNTVSSSGQTLAPDDGTGEASNQLAIALSIYAAGGAYYADSGAANAYVLSTVGSKVAPDAYFDGMGIIFEAGNNNTGASTVNVATKGVKDIVMPDGTALPPDVINGIVSAVFDNGNDRFVLQSTAQAISFDDSGVGFTAANVQAAIQQIGSATGTSYSFPQLIGTVLAIANLSVNAITVLNDTDIAYIDTFNTELRTYRFNGSTWALVGAGLSIPGAGTPGLAALNGTDVAFIDQSIEELRTYRFNGATWALVGTGLSIAGILQPALTALNGTDVVFIDATLESLRTYRFNGSTWALVGSGLSVPGIDDPALTTLNGTDVAFIDATLESLRTYRFNGSTWALVGSGLSVPGIDNPALTGLNGTDVAFYAATSNELRAYRFNGSTWSAIGSGTTIAAGQGSKVAALNGIDVAFTDNTANNLGTYRFGLEVGSGPFRP